METQWVPKHGIEISTLSIKGIRGKGRLALVKAPMQIIRAIIQALKVIKKVKPDCVLGMGGFVTGPGGVAARLSGRPLVIHEQNAVAGLTNKLLSRIADRVLEAFPDSFGRASKAILTGNPVRDTICELYRRNLLEFGQMEKSTHIGGNKTQEPLKVLVIGGSLGAVVLNKIVPAALHLLEQESWPQVIHQTGSCNLESAQKEYEERGLLNTFPDAAVPFIQDMTKAYSWADIVICRSGALTVSELCMAGVGAILVPFPSAVDDHQTRNAEFMVKGGAAILVQQNQLTAEYLAELLREMTLHREKGKAMGQSALKLAKPNATEIVVTYCEEMCHV